MRAMLEDANVSLRGMADAAGVSRPTLVHYFGSREGAVQAAFERAAEVGQRDQRWLAEAPITTARETLTNGLAALVMGWHHVGIGNLHYVGLQLGLADPAHAAIYPGEDSGPSDRRRGQACRALGR